MSKKKRGEIGENIVNSLLNQIKGYHILLSNYNYINPKTKMSHQIDQIYISPYGLFVIETKNYYGKISSNSNDSRWIVDINGKKKDIANPLIQNNSHRLLINHLLNKKYESVSLVVFIQNNAPIDIDDNVINLTDLEAFISNYPYQKMLTLKDIDFIYTTLKQNEATVDIDAHVKNIKYLKEKKKVEYKEKEYAIESRKCPRCNSNLLIKGLDYTCPSCRYHFSLK